MKIISSLNTIALKYQQQNIIPPFKAKENNVMPNREGILKGHKI